MGKAQENDRVSSQSLGSVPAPGNIVVQRVLKCAQRRHAPDSLDFTALHSRACATPGHTRAPPSNIDCAWIGRRKGKRREFMVARLWKPRRVVSKVRHACWWPLDNLNGVVSLNVHCEKTGM